MGKTKNVIEILKGLVPDNIYNNLKDTELNIDVFDMSQLITEADDFILCKDILSSYNINYEILPQIKTIIDKSTWFTDLNNIIEDVNMKIENGFDLDEIAFIVENLVPVCGLLNDIIEFNTLEITKIVRYPVSYSMSKYLSSNYPNIAAIGTYELQKNSNSKLFDSIPYIVRYRDSRFGKDDRREYMESYLDLVNTGNLFSVLDTVDLTLKDPDNSMYDINTEIHIYGNTSIIDSYKNDLNLFYNKLQHISSYMQNNVIDKGYELTNNITEDWLAYFKEHNIPICFVGFNAYKLIQKDNKVFLIMLVKSHKGLNNIIGVNIEDYSDYIMIYEDENKYTMTATI